MKTNFIYFLLIVGQPFFIWSQPTITNAGDLITGSVFQYKNCNTAGVVPGNSGPNVIWNFSGVTAITGTLTRSILSPSSTSNGSLFPSSNLVEKYSDGNFIYSTKTSTASFMDGIVDTSSNFSITYTNSILVCKKQVTMGTQLTDTFAGNFTSGGYNFTTKGTITLTGDAYGTLILPAKTYSNVLRVKLMQVEKDSLIQFGSVSTSTYVTFLWFDGISPAEILRIDSLSTTTPGAPAVKDVRYIINDNLSTTGIVSNIQAVDFRFYPNPAKDEITINTPGNGELRIQNHLGIVIESSRIEDTIKSISVAHCPPGVYFMTFDTGTFKQVSKLVIQR